MCYNGCIELWEVRKTMKKMKQLLCALLVLCMMLPVLPVGAQETVTLKMMGLDQDSSGRDWTVNAFFTRMAELTGVSFEFEQYTDEETYLSEKAKLSTRKELPDVLFKAALTEADQRKFAADGTLIDLKPLIAENAPHLAALLAENPQWEKAITLPDGKIVALPLINEMERQVGLWMNAAWIEALGLELPSNAQELYDVLVAMKNGDPNQNGKNDEIALNLTGVWEMRWLLNLFGINANDYNLAMENGSVVFAPRMAGYREFVEYLKKLFDEGLMSETAFRDAHAFLALSEKEKDTILSGAFVSVTPYTHVEAEPSMQYVVMVPDNGVWRDMLGQVWGGTFAVTKDCKDPAAALRWVDALYDANNILAYAGVEGVDYEVTKNGWMWILDTYRTVDTIRAESIIYTGGTIPGVMPSEFMRQVDSELDRHVTLNSDALKAIAVPSLPYRIPSDAEIKRLGEIQPALAEAVDVGIARFATGEVELTDETWQAYQDSLTALGADELTEIFNGIIAR